MQTSKWIESIKAKTKEKINKKPQLNSFVSKNNLLMELFSKISKGNRSIPANDMRVYLKSKGFLSDDPHWTDVYHFLNSIDSITEDNFDKIFCNNISDLTKCVNGNFVIEDFDLFTNTLNEIFENQRKYEGTPASYIPQLARQNPNKYGFSFCSIEFKK